MPRFTRRGLLQTTAAAIATPAIVRAQGDVLRLGVLTPLTGVKGFPARVKCATLAWHAVEAALRSGGKPAEPVKTE